MPPKKQPSPKAPRRRPPQPQPQHHENEDFSPSDEGGDFGEFQAVVAAIPDHVNEGFGNAQIAPGGAESPPVELIDIGLIKSALGPSFNAIFNAVSVKRGDHWKLQPFEQDALVGGWSPILQYLLSKLGNQEQVLLSVAMISTAAIVGGKVAQDAIRQVSKRANTRTAESGGSSAFSASGEAVRAPEAGNSYE